MFLHGASFRGESMLSFVCFVLSVCSIHSDEELTLTFHCCDFPPIGLVCLIHIESQLLNSYNVYSISSVLGWYFPSRTMWEDMSTWCLWCSINLSYNANCLGDIYIYLDLISFLGLTLLFLPMDSLPHVIFILKYNLICKNLVLY